MFWFDILTVNYHYLLLFSDLDFEKRGTARPVTIVDVGLAGIFTLIVSEAHRHVKCTSTEGLGYAPKKF